LIHPLYLGAAGILTISETYHCSFFLRRCSLKSFQKRRRCSLNLCDFPPKKRCVTFFKKRICVIVWLNRTVSTQTHSCPNSQTSSFQNMRPTRRWLIIQKNTRHCSLPCHACTRRSSSHHDLINSTTGENPTMPATASSTRSLPSRCPTMRWSPTTAAPRQPP
jgi:hypothetical protein